MKAWMFGIGVLVLIIAGAFFFILGNGSAGNMIDTPQEQLPGKTQQVILSMKDFNYYPNTVTVKAGEPVSIFMDSSVAGCLRSFVIRDLGVSGVARTPQDTIDFTPTKKGTYRFSCSMGMGSGTLVVD